MLHSSLYLFASRLVCRESVRSGSGLILLQRIRRHHDAFLEQTETLDFGPQANRSP